MPPHESQWVLRRHFVIHFKAKGVQAFFASQSKGDAT